jgi:hypothetical protein
MQQCQNKSKNNYNTEKEEYLNSNCLNGSNQEENFLK